MDIVICFADDLSSRLAGENSLEATEERSGIPGNPDRSDMVPAECIASTADAIRTIRTGGELGGHAHDPQSSTAAEQSFRDLAIRGTAIGC